MDEQAVVSALDASAAGLRFVTDDQPGITRRRAGTGWSYRGPGGKLLRDNKDLERIRSLAIPPAWTDVWICPNPRGHIQATGRDARGRKQYRYHPRWREIRDANKYERVMTFAAALPKLRERVAADLRRHGLPREKVIAAVIRLMETTYIRIGNQEYAKANQSYGLTTLQDEHAEVNGGKMRFRFRGKSGVEHNVTLRDRRLARIVQRCQDLPGQTLFQFVDDDNVQHELESDDVNEYLRNALAEEYSAKDVRTWAGTVLAARSLATLGPAESVTAAKRNIVTAIDEVAIHLGNTRAVCRKCYVHPAVLEAYELGIVCPFPPEDLNGEMNSNGNGTGTELVTLSGPEAAVLAFLEERSG